MSERITLTAFTEEQADELLYQLYSYPEHQPADIRHYAQIVADRLGIAFCVDHEGNVRVDNGTVRWSGRP